MSRTTGFDREDVLKNAMDVFWSKGFDGTSMSDLVDATGLLKGSIYNTFKSKENLFLLCLEKYANNSAGLHFKSGDAREYLKAFFQRLVDQGVDKNFTQGCFVMNSCLEFTGNHSTNLKNKSKLFFSATEKNFKNVVEAILGDTADEDQIERAQSVLVGAAFSIREISKFKKDRTFLTEIANSALKELNLSI